MWLYANSHFPSINPPPEFKIIVERMFGNNNLLLCAIITKEYVHAEKNRRDSETIYLQKYICPFNYVTLH